MKSQASTIVDPHKKMSEILVVCLIVFSILVVGMVLAVQGQPCDVPAQLIEYEVLSFNCLSWA